MKQTRSLSECSCLSVYTRLYLKGTIVFLQELGFALHEDRWQIENRYTLYHLHYAQKVLNMSCCRWRSHLILTWALYLKCVLGKMKNEIQEFHKFWFCVY